MINDAHTTNGGSGNQSQDGNQNSKLRTLAQQVTSMKARGRWIDRTDQKPTLIKLREDLDKLTIVVQDKLEGVNSMDHKDDPMLMLEQMEKREVWSTNLKSLQKIRKRLSERANELLKPAGSDKS